MLNQRVFQLPRHGRRRQLANLQRRTDPGRFTLAAPSPALPEPLGRRRGSRAAESIVGAPPAAGVPRSAEVENTVVVVGDSDWPGPPDWRAIPALFGEGGGRLFAETWWTG